MIKKLNENKSQILQSSKRLTETALNTASGVVTKATTEVDTYISPIRTSVLKRFPILFSLLTTFGVATTFLGFEKIVEVFVMGLFLAGITSLFLSVIRSKGRTYRIPFAPFLLAGYLFVMVME